MWVAFENKKKEVVVQCQGIELAIFEKVEDEGVSFLSKDIGYCSYKYILSV